MYSSFNKSLTEINYLIERISIITKEFLNKLNKNNISFNLLKQIYKSTQAINYEFTKLCYCINSDKTINLNISDTKNINIPFENIKTISEYKNFTNNSINTLKDSLNFIYKSSGKYSTLLNKEIDNFESLIDTLKY